jgi:hypothetical protein
MQVREIVTALAGVITINEIVLASSAHGGVAICTHRVAIAA